jgi:hypothetical protein
MVKWLQRLTMLWGAFFVVLHDPTGTAQYVNAEQIDVIRPAAPETSTRVCHPQARGRDQCEIVVSGYDAKGSRSRIMVYGTYWLAVRETPDEIKTLIDAALKQ